VNGVGDTWLLPGFVLTNEGRKAIEERDSWLITSTPLWKEETTPNSQDPLEMMRVERERNAVAQYNRLAGANDALLMGDTVAGIAHVMDAMYMSLEDAAQTRAMRDGVATNNMTFVEKREQLRNAAASSSSRVLLAQSSQHAHAINQHIAQGFGVQAQTASLTATETYSAASLLPSTSSFLIPMSASPLHNSQVAQTAYTQGEIHPGTQMAAQGFQQTAPRAFLPAVPWPKRRGGRRNNHFSNGGNEDGWDKRELIETETQKEGWG
jgi:hypothetical protein